MRQPFEWGNKDHWHWLPTHFDTARLGVVLAQNQQAHLYVPGQQVQPAERP
jgi:hypothetical protein